MPERINMANILSHVLMFNSYIMKATYFAYFTFHTLATFRGLNKFMI